MNNFKLKENIDFLVIIGPTAVGKTDFSIDVAKKYNGEIINGDSVQVYKKLNIGSAKISKDEMQGIPHHLIDIKEPNEEYTIADFQRDALKAIEDIKSRGKLPIIVGGSGLYINSVIYDYNTIKIPEDMELKEQLTNLSSDELFEYVKEKCLEENIEIHVNNRARLIGYAYKIKKNLPLKESLKMKNCQVVSLTTNREILYERINKRVDIMLKKGLVDEVKQFNRLDPSQSAIGYKEVHMYLNNEISYDKMVESIKQNSRRFAKRQITWFKNQIPTEDIEVKYE